MKKWTSTPQIQDWPVNNLKEGEDGQSRSKYHSTASGVPNIGVAPCPIAAEELVVPVQVNRDNMHTNVHVELLTRVQVHTVQKTTEEDTTPQLLIQQIIQG